MRNKQRPVSAKKARRSATRRSRASRVAERRKVEEVLRESEERFRNIAERSYDVITAVDSEGRFTFVSPSIERISGYRPEDLVGGQFQNFVPESEIPKVVRAFDSMMKGESIEGLQVEMKRKDGSLVQVEVNGSPIRRNGRVVGMQGIIRDITERKRVEEELRESVERYRSLYDSTLDGIYRSTHEGRFVDVNPAFVKMFGYSSKQEMLNIKNIAEELYFSPEDRGSHILDTGKDEVESYRMRRKDGSEIWVEDHSRDVHDEQGNIIYHEGIMRDITERKRAEEALANERNVLRTLIDNLPDNIFVKDTESRFVISNLAHAHLLRAKAPDEIVGKTDYDIFPPELAASYRADEQAVIHSGQPLLNREERTIDPEGKTRWLLTTKVPLRNDQGKVIGIAGINRDITERKVAEEALRAVVYGCPIPQFVIDRNHRVTYWNNALEEITGIRAEEVVGTRDQWRAFYSQERACMADLLLDGLTERIPELYAGKYSRSRLVADAYEATDYFPRLGKTGAWLYFTAAPIRDSQGNIIGAVETLEDITERKRAEEALANERNVLRTLIDNLPDYIFVKDVESRLITYNLAEGRKLAHLLHAETPDAVVGKRDIDIYPQELAASYYADEQAVIHTGQPLLNREERAINPEGKTRWVLTSKVPLRNDQGNIIGLVGISRDITERKATEEALANERNVLRTLIDNLPDNIFIKDAESRFVITNLVHVHHLRAKTLDEIVGKTDFDIYPQELAASYYADEQAVIRSGQPLVNREERTIDPEGKTRWFLTTKVPLRNDQGKVIGIVGVNRDITERKRMEEKLRQYSSNLEQIVAERTSKLAESERRFRELADLLPQIVFETDENGNIQFMNRAGFEATGHAEEELRSGLNIFQTFSVDDVAKERIRRMMTGEKLGGREVTVLRRDGTTFPAMTYAAPIMREGKAVGLRGIAVDITDRKKLEAQLVESQRLAAIGETATMVGHDLRNPLQAMTSTLYVVKRLATSDKVDDRKEAVGLLGSLDDAIEYMDKIVSDLQDYSRPVGAEPVETNLPVLIRDSVSGVRVPRNVEVAVNVEDGLSNVKLDPALFRRVLTNLILNAVQAMPNGGKLTITSSSEDDSLTVSVQDTGVGIAPENLGRVFAPFFTTKAKGQGLGLAVCKRLTEAQGGTIEVASSLGEGSTFTLKIPTESR